MTKKELIERMTGQSGFATKKEAQRALEVVTSAIASAAATERVNITGFGSFEMRRREARRGMLNGQPVEHAAKIFLAFTDKR